jgi:hypothetical protein
MTIHYLYRDPYDSIEEQARIAAVEADTRRDIRIVWLQRIAIAATWIVVTGYALSLWIVK